MSEINKFGKILYSFTDVNKPHHLFSMSKDRVLVADCGNHRILLLTSESQQQLKRVVKDTDFPLELSWSMRLCYNELTSKLYVAHGTSERASEFISLYRLL